MKKKLLFTSLLLACLNAQGASVEQGLKNHTFLLKLWPLKGAAQCLQYDYEDGEEKVIFNNCFQPKDALSNTPLRQVFIFDNNRLKFPEGESPTYSTCIRAKNAKEVVFDNNCSDGNSEFEFIPFHNAISPGTKKNNRFLIKSKKFGTCLQQDLTNKKQSALAQCHPSSEDQLFGAALKTQMIRLDVKNLNKHSRHVMIDVYNDNTLAYSTKLEFVKKGKDTYTYIPDFRSYLQDNVEEKAYTDSSLFPTKDFSGFQIRATEDGQITIDNKKYQILFKNDIEPYASILSGDAEQQSLKMDFTFNEDQISLLPYSTSQAYYSIPDDWVVTMFTTENYLSTSPKDDFLLWFGNPENDPEGKPYKSIRFLQKDDGKTFQITDESGTLGFTASHGLVYNNVPEQAAYKKRGFWDRNSRNNKVWRKGNVICERDSGIAPDCAMLKETNSEAVYQPFTNTKYWYPFDFKTYNPKKGVAKGELFYQTNKGKLELWYSRVEGFPGTIPFNSISNNQWFFMGYYKDLVTFLKPE